MIRLLVVIFLWGPLLGECEGIAEKSKKQRNQKVYIVVIETKDGVRFIGRLIDVSDSTLTLMQVKGGDTAFQFINSQKIQKITFRRKRSTLAIAVIAVGSFVSVGLVVASLTVRPGGGSGDLTALNIVPGVVFGATTVYLFSKITVSLPKSIRIDGNPAKFKKHGMTILKLTGR